MRRLSIVLVILLALLIGGLVGQHPITEAQNQGTVQISPDHLSGEICGDGCLTQTVEIQFSPLGEATINQLDVLLLMDVTTSMGDEIATVQRSAVDIAHELQQLVPDTRFGAAIFADYSDNLPWQLVSDFTTDFDALSQAIAGIPMMGGGDRAESYTRALWESSLLDWRENAVHILVLFTDDEPHYDDPGRDEQENTSDDLTYDAVLAGLTAQRIRVISVDAGGFFSNAKTSLQQAADTTQGRYVALNSADEIPEQVVSLIEGELAEFQLAFISQSETQTGWVTQSPERFDYLSEGGSLLVTLSFCPRQLGLNSDHYIIPLDLRSGEQVFGTVTLDVSYAAQCVNLVIPDTLEDTGDRCSDIGENTFWESPAIIVRRAPDGGQTFETPLPRHENYVYVRVQNTGQVDALPADIILYSSLSVMVADFPADWTEVGRQTVTLPAGQAAWVGPYSWMPAGDVISLRAVAQSTEDDITKPNDFACDSNIAQVNRLPLLLNNYTLVPGKVAALFRVTFRNPPEMDYESLDLLVDSSHLPDDSVLAYRSQPEFMQIWEDGEGRLDGADLRETNLGEPEIHFDIRDHSDIVYNFVQQSGSMTSGEILVAVDDPQQSGEIRIGLRAKDRIVTGVTLIPAGNRIYSETEVGLDDSPLLPILIPALLFLTLVVISAIVLLVQSR